MVITQHALSSSFRMGHARSRWPRIALIWIVLATVVAVGRDAHSQAELGGGTAVVAPQNLPVPKGARALVIDAEQQEIRFQTEAPIKDTAEFLQTKLKALGWKPTFEQVASTFANIRYEQGGRQIMIRAKKENIFKPTVRITISGDGIAWQGAPTMKQAPSGSHSAQGAAPAVSPRSVNDGQPAGEGIKSSEIHSLEPRRRVLDGGLEIIEFVSRRPVQENVAFFEEQLTGKGWRKTVAKQDGEVQSLRFEQGGRYIRLGMWPYASSDNDGPYQGTKGAVEGTGLIWSASVPSGNVPERQLAEAEQYLGKLSKEKREWLLAEIRRKREAAFWPEGLAPDSALTQPPGQTGAGAARTSGPRPAVGGASQPATRSRPR